MANQLKLQVLLAAVDKITRPLKSIQGAAGQTSQEMRDTQARIKELNQVSGKVDGYRKVSRQVGITGNELKKLKQTYRELGGQLKQTENPSKQLTQEFARAKSEYQKVVRQQRQNIEVQNRHKEALAAAGISTKTLKSQQQGLTNQLGEANRALEQQRAKLERINAQQKRMAQARQNYNSTKQLQGQLAGQGAKYAAGGGAALYGASQVLAPGLQFGAEISKLQALTRLDKDDSQLAELRKQARDLGATTSFSANDVAQGQGFMAMAGFDPKAIKAAMPGVLDMAKAGGVEIAEAADIGSNILSGFKLPADQMGRLGDVLVGTFTRANVDLAMLGETMKYAGPVAAEMGVSMETAAAMAGKLGDAGIQGSQGGTALRAIMGRLAKPPKAAAEALAELGIQAADAQGNLRNMPDILKELSDKTQGMGDTVKAGYLKALAGEEAFAALAVLTNQAGSGELQKLINELGNAQGTAARVSSTMADNAMGDLQSLGSAWQDIGIELFDNNSGGIRDLIQSVTGITRAVGLWIKENPELVATLSKVFAVIAGLAVVGGTLALIIAGLLGPFAAINFAMATFGITSGVALGPVLLVIAAVAALAGVVYLVYKNWDAIGAYFAGLWDEVKAGFSGGLTGILGLLVNFSPIGLFYRAFAAVMSYFGTELPATFTGFGGMILDGLLNGISAKLGAAKDKIVGVGQSVKGWFKETLGINSPSKVFTQYGDDTMAGLANGLAKNHDPEQQVTGMANKLKAAGAALAIGATALPAAALPAAAAIPDTSAAVARIQTQQQEQVQNHPARAAAAPAVQEFKTVFEPGAIVIHAAPGMDAQELAMQVQRQIEAHERRKAAQNRAKLTDLE